MAKVMGDGGRRGWPRRKFLQYGGAATAAAIATAFSGDRSAAQTSNALTIRWLGHTCFFFSGGGLRVLTNPFNTLGCTAGYRAPNVSAELVTISSQLLDEGYVSALPGDPGLLYEPGVFEFKGVQFSGVRTDHDRQGGRRFGNNIVWKWTQAGINIAHLGGIAGPVSIDEKILLGRPDVAIVPVGGGPKAYDAQEAIAAIQTIQPKIVIPSHYRTAAADAEACEIAAVEAFLEQLPASINVQRIGGDSISMRASDLPPQGTAVRVLTYPF